MAYTFDSLDTFDEGVVLGGLRNKHDIKVLICYLYYSIKENMSKDIIVSAINNEGLANYFEISSAFDDLVQSGNLNEITNDNQQKAFALSESGSLIAAQLEPSLAHTVKEKAYACAVKLLIQKKNKSENFVDIVKIKNGFDVQFTISGGNISLLKFSLYAPTIEQAEMMKKNFYEYPSSIYKVMLALVTKDRETAGEALEELYRI